MAEWVKRADIEIIADCGKSKAQAILREANRRIAEQGYVIVDRRKAPKDFILEMLGIERKDTCKNSKSEPTTTRSQ